MDLKKEIEELKERIKMLEMLIELKKKVEELEKENSKQVFIPYPYPVPQPYITYYRPTYPPYYQPIWTTTWGTTSTIDGAAYGGSNLTCNS